jgi:hypothetical protein
LTILLLPFLLSDKRDADAVSEGPEDSSELCFQIPLEIHMKTTADDRATARLSTEQRRRGALSARWEIAIDHFWVARIEVPVHQPRGKIAEGIR